MGVGGGAVKLIVKGLPNPVTKSYPAPELKLPFDPKVISLKYVELTDDFAST